MRKLNVGWDLDGVLYDFKRAYHMFAMSRGYLPDGFDHVIEPTIWNFFDEWGVEIFDFLRHCNEGVDAGVIFREGPVNPGGVDILNKCTGMGHKNVVITDRSFGTRSHHNTSDWITEHQLPVDSLVFSSDKTLVNVDIMIDDRDVNFYALLEAGRNIYLLDRAYNQHVEAGDRRIFSLEEYFDKIVELSDDDLNS